MLADLPTLAGISDDQRDPSQIETVLRERGVDFVTYLPCQARSGQVIVERVQRLHIICSLEGCRFGYSPLAHAALHLRNRLVFVLLHPPLDACDDVGQSTRAMR